MSRKIEMLDFRILREKYPDGTVKDRFQTKTKTVYITEFGPRSIDSGWKDVPIVEREIQAETKNETSIQSAT